MELGVRLVGVILRILYVLTAPLFWLLARNTKSVSPIRDPILLRSATNLVTAIRNGELTSEKVTYAFIGRIHEVNLQLNAVVDQRFREAMEEARAVDGEVAAARSAGTLDQLFKNKPLLGIPFTVKESCSLAGLSNAVGCVDWEGRRATSDGEAVARMRKAGGIPLLVSNTPELCLGWETTNLVTGTTNNPYCIARTSGGSSGGESALLGCGASVASVSSDIAGSIRIPAAFCGVFGHKPTPGLVPYEGHIPTLSDPLFPQYLSVGPQCRFAEDLSLLLRVMAGPGALDETPVSCDKLRAGHSLALIEVEPALRDVIERAALYLRDECGAALCHELENTVEMSVSIATRVSYWRSSSHCVARRPGRCKRLASRCCTAQDFSSRTRAGRRAAVPRVQLARVPPRPGVHAHVGLLLQHVVQRAGAARHRRSVMFCRRQAIGEGLWRVELPADDHLSGLSAIYIRTLFLSQRIFFN
ncbi:unnamed protein product [Leptidea sinapis]|uniref:Amidase domain-containing protein n=1 Tax=Leptidea sinapis TaxID=189913 RepID=A0A5E4PWK3_9NEOP|nr:unnamed protein product [Leptidea sinapis]